ncbi:unnamed protein product [Mytilus edulis]|uniref:Uncharacterized protein n=1 Tax=Mytilus edulis TaxID=6550 RepID=A0A8S3R6T1_MYTED|nr:unnamed protein product [Mytilus edulis]
MSETKVTFGQSADEALALLKNIQNIVSKLESRIENIEKEVSEIEDIQLISMSFQVNSMEKRVQEVEDRKRKIVDSVEERSQIVNSALDKYTDNSDQIEILNKAIKALQNTKDNRKLDEVHVSKLRSLEEDVVEMKWRSMQNNLIFSGLRYQPDEDTEIKIRDFINKELGLYNTISFGNVHRFGKKDRNGIRPIVARFTSRRDLEYVLKCAYRLKGTDYGIKEQFPKEIELKRKELYPILKQAKKDNNKAVLVRDRLYINGELYKPQPNISNTQGREFRDSLIDRPTHSQIPVNSGPPVPPRPYKRSRINSDEIENTHL